MVKAGRSSSASGSGRRSQRRSWRAPHVQAAETSPSIEDRVAVRADTAAAQDGPTPQLIYRSRNWRSLSPSLRRSSPHKAKRQEFASLTALQIRGAGATTGGSSTVSAQRRRLEFDVKLPLQIAALDSSIGQKADRWRRLCPRSDFRPPRPNREAIGVPAQRRLSELRQRGVDLLQQLLRALIFSRGARFFEIASRLRPASSSSRTMHRG